MVQPMGEVKFSSGTRFSMQLLVSETRQYTITSSITAFPFAVAALCQLQDNGHMQPPREAAFPAMLVLLLALSAPACAEEAHPPRYDYPTAARADYVIGCLAANGFKREFLPQCACGIDVIADRMSYEAYERADTILSMQRANVGPRGGLFRDTPVARDTLTALRRAQAEANLRCGG